MQGVPYFVYRFAHVLHLKGTISLSYYSPPNEKSLNNVGRMLKTERQRTNTEIIQIYNIVRIPDGSNKITYRSKLHKCDGTVCGLSHLTINTASSSALYLSEAQFCNSTTSPSHQNVP